MSEYIVKCKEFVSISGATMQFPEYIDMNQEIVRCRDCRHFTPKGTQKFVNGKTNTDFCEYVRGWRLQITPDGYCKWGERRDA